jgi:hypothetical protein
MAVETEHGGWFGQHAGIVAAVHSVACLAISFLDRTVLGLGLGILMAVQTYAALKWFYLYDFSGHLMTVIAVTILDRFVYDLFE